MAGYGLLADWLGYGQSDPGSTLAGGVNDPQGITNVRNYALRQGLAGAAAAAGAIPSASPLPISGWQALAAASGGFGQGQQQAYQDYARQQALGAETQATKENTLNTQVGRRMNIAQHNLNARVYNKMYGANIPIFGDEGTAEGSADSSGGYGGVTVPQAPDQSSGVQGGGNALGHAYDVSKWDPKLLESIRLEAIKNNVPISIATKMVAAESNGNPNAVSSAGARGYTQLLPSTAKDLGVDINNPQQNLAGGIKYLGQMINKYKDLGVALAAYNAGPGNIDKWLASGADPSQLHPETRDYVSHILAPDTQSAAVAMPGVVQAGGGSMNLGGQPFLPTQSGGQPSAPSDSPNQYQGMSSNMIQQAIQQLYVAQQVGDQKGIAEANQLLDSAAKYNPEWQGAIEAAKAAATDPYTRGQQANKAALDAENTLQKVTIKNPDGTQQDVWMTIAQIKQMNGGGQSQAGGLPAGAPAQGDRSPYAAAGEPKYDPAIQAGLESRAKAINDGQTGNTHAIQDLDQGYARSTNMLSEAKDFRPGYFAQWTGNVRAMLQGVTGANDQALASWQSFRKDAGQRSLTQVQSVSPRAAQQVVKMVLNLNANDQMSLAGIQNVIGTDNGINRWMHDYKMAELQAANQGGIPGLRKFDATWEQSHPLEYYMMRELPPQRAAEFWHAIPPERQKALDPIMRQLAAQDEQATQ